MNKRVNVAAPETMSREQFRDEFLHMAEAQNLDVDVLGDGPLNASVAIVGEGPGETEVRKGAPFVGGSGSLLFDALRRYGLHRANLYTTNVVKRQISLTRKGNERHVVHRDELAKWFGMLEFELSKLPNLRTVFALGNYALEALSAQTGIMNWRGSVLDVKLPNGQIGKVIHTINPAYALREPKMEPVFLMDCSKLDMVNRGTFKPYVIDRLINPSHREALDFIREIKSKPARFAYDIEIINGETACHGLAISPNRSMCINLRDTVRNRYSLQDEADILLALQDLCDSHKVVAQNGQFDAYWVRLKDNLCVTISHDTLLAHHTLYPQLPHSLAFLCAQYTTHPFYKDEGKQWREGGDIDQFWRYNCTDTAITLRCADQMDKELQAQGLTKFYYDHVMRAQPHLVSATVHGVAVDTERKAKITEVVSEDVAKKEAEFLRLARDAAGDENLSINPGSPKQMGALLFGRLGLRGRGTSTDKTNRDHILKNPQTSSIAKEMIGAYNQWAKDAKFLSTYAESRVGNDGRFRCEYRQFGVSSAPGRLSSTSLLTGEGGNMQNQPPRAREMYVADPGTVFIYFDLSQAEARVVAWRANIEKWKAQFEQARKDGKFDCHRALASEMFKVPYDAVPLKDHDTNNNPTIRYIAKRCRHGLNYRMERFRLSEVTGLPYSQAASAFVKYHQITPELAKWWQAAESDFRKTRVAYNALGRRWKVIQRLDDNVLNSVVAFYPQSTIGDKITQVWYQAEEDDQWPEDARVCIDVHDNLVALATPKVAKTALKILKRYAESPIMVQDAWNKAAQPLIIPAELKMSYPVSLVKDKNGKEVWTEDKKGQHRWSHMKAVEL